VDFVVVGFGLGALSVLLGVVMLGWLAPRSQRAAARVSTAGDAARYRAVAADHRGTGQAFLYAGGAMLLATVAGLVGSLDDRTGAFLVTTTATVAAVGILLGGYLQRARNPVPPRRRTRSASVASASIATAPLSTESPSLFAEEPPSVQAAAGTEIDVEGPQTEDYPASDSRIPAETTDSGSGQLADRAASNGSGDTDLAETEDAQDAEHVAPAARVAESPSSQPDEEDPSSGRQS
jgi:hypothetical protein